MIFLLAAGLFVFEAARIGRKPSPIDDSLQVDGEVMLPHSEKNSGELRNPSSEKTARNNLNRLDPVTRVVHGVKQCK